MNVSRRTIINRSNENDIKFKQPCIKPLTDEHKLKRLEWAIKNIDTDWELVYFSDESQICKGPHGKYRWVDTKENDHDYNSKHPIKINIWGGIKYSI